MLVANTVGTTPLSALLLLSSSTLGSSTYLRDGISWNANTRYLKPPPNAGGGGGSGGGGGGGGVDDSICTYNEGQTTRRWTLSEVAAEKAKCLTVFYDTVYEMDMFIPIHKGGSEAILRNCGTDATWFFETLQCIQDVPDHFEGMLNMCASSIIGYIRDSDKDPCKNSNPNDFWEPPTYTWPVFEECDVYDKITCDVMDKNHANYGLISHAGPADGRWESQAQVLETQIADANGYHGGLVNGVCPEGVNATDCWVDHCYVILHDWVYDLGVSPLDGSAPFYKKHGNGMFPQAILKHCGYDMTAKFDEAIYRPQDLCTPDHTLGGMNVLFGYVVGTMKDSVIDPCVAGQVPPTACETFHNKGLKKYYDSSWKREAACTSVVLGKVYNMTEFKDRHHGGSGSIGCGKDLTSNFLSKSWHIPQFHLGQLQGFQLGVIAGSVTDPCENHDYDPELDF